MTGNIFLIVLLFFVVQRIAELVLSKQNEKWLLQNGAVEYGKSHYKFIVIVHALFYISLITEFYLSQGMIFFIILLVILIFCQIIRIWIILTLGKFWNVKIYRIPDSPLMKKGLYKYFKHPNYILVCLEILILPVTFGLYITAIAFSIFNAIVLYIRIKTENEALSS